MNNYNFDNPQSRKGTSSYKWDYNLEQFGDKNVIPFWVADMDFPCPDPIIDAVKLRADHHVYGYTIREQDYMDAVQNWLAVRHGWDVNPDWLLFCPPGAIHAINTLVEILTEQGDEVVVQTPAYNPLVDVITGNGRILVENPLVNINGEFTFDFDQLEKVITPQTKMMILCSPHNPTGRVWSWEELERLATICEKNDLIVISDEVHSDLLYAGVKHHPYGSLNQSLIKKSITIISPSKTFNTSGLPQSSLIIPDEAIRAKFKHYLAKAQLNLDNIFGATALIAGYNECGDWLDQLMAYVSGNFDLLDAFMTEHFPAAVLTRPQGTYLAWLDLRGLGLTREETMRRLVTIGGVGLYDGTEFGPQGDGFYRINLACSRDLLQKGLDGFKKALG